MYDAIVVGARCAGSPTAMLLARRGHKVLLLDRASFPSDTLSTHFIQMPGMVRLREWGLLDTVMATGCPPIVGGLLMIDGQAAEANFEVPTGIPGLAAPRRTVLDKILVDAAAAAGVEVREGAMVDSLVFEGERVVGVRGHDANGAFEERGRFVIGADGRHSLVAEAVGASDIRFHKPFGGGFYSYWAEVECTSAELYAHSEGFTVAFPTNDDLVTVAMAFPQERFEKMRKNPEEEVLLWLDGLGTLGSRVREGRRAHQLIPVANVANQLRHAWGPGWALVGDAAYVKDPTPADGISDSWRGADLLVTSLGDVLSARASEEDAMARYQETLNDVSIPLLEKTVQMSNFELTATDRAMAFFEIQQLHLEELAAMQTTGVAS